MAGTISGSGEKIQLQPRRSQRCCQWLRMLQKIHQRRYAPFLYLLESMLMSLEMIQLSGYGTGDKKSSFVGKRIDLKQIPQYTKAYDRGEDVELWEIKYVR